MKCIFSIFLIFAICYVYSQNEDIDLEQFADRFFQIQGEDFDYENIYESLLQYYTRKIDLNKADRQTLASIYLMTPKQIEDLLNYREKYGELLSINELQAISSFDVATIRSIQPFVQVKKFYNPPGSLLSRMINENNRYFIMSYTRRLQMQRGYETRSDTTFIENLPGVPIDTLLPTPSQFAGSPVRLYGRFRSSLRDDFSMGVTFEKDAGEKWTFDKGYYGFDYYSYHLSLENKLGFKKIILGDYTLQIGQGLIFGAGFTTGKGSETVNSIRRPTIGVRPYTSVLESGFFRGASVTYQIGKFNLIALYSSLPQDGNIMQDTTFSDFDEYVRTISNVGLHRTQNEKNIRKKIRETSLGGVVYYRPNKRLLIGTAVLKTKYSISVMKKPNHYNLFEFKGDRNYLYSTFFSYVWQNFLFFGEAGQSKSGGLGMVGGFVSSLSHIIDFSMLLRNYEKDFHSFYGNALSENTRNINERGIYMGIRIAPNRKHQISAYYDIFRFPWLKYNSEAPSEGYEWLTRYTFTPSRKIILYIQTRQQLRQVNKNGDGNLNLLTDEVKQNYLFNVDYELQQGLKFRTKLQYSTLKEAGNLTSGIAIIQDVNFTFWKCKFSTRTAIFDTDNFSNAQYAYERDVLYAFSIPAYSGRGIRNYVMLRFDPLRKLSLWIRYAQYAYRDRNTVGNGLLQSQSNLSSEFKILARLKF